MIESIKDLERLLKLCRKQGVTKITLPQVSFELGDLPYSESKAIPLDELDADPLAGFPQGVLSNEQLMYYSSGGKPEDDPFVEETQQ